jgi:hypothetical protein
MSKPAATSKDTHARPQTAVDGFSARIIRRTTSSDLNPKAQPELQRQLTNKSLQKVQDSFLSFSPLETEGPSPFDYPGSAVASEPSPPPELKRKRSLLRKTRPPPTPQTPYSSRDPPSASLGSFLPSPSPKVLTPAASLIEEYKESERRRAKLAQAAGEAFAKPVKSRTPSASPSPLMKDHGLPPASPFATKESVPSRPATASGLEKGHIPEWLSDAPFSDYYVSLKHPPVTSPLPISSPSAQPRKSVDRPSLRINIDSGSHSSRSRHPNSSFDLEGRPKVPHPRGISEFGDLAKKKHPPKLAETPSMEGSSPQGSKLWKIVKRLSSSVLREKSVNEGIKSHDIPPVPVIPENFKGSSSTHPSRQSSLSPAVGNKYDKPLSSAGGTPLANREAKKRSSTTVASSGLSSELAPSGFFAKQPPSNRSSTSSYGNDIVTIQFSRPITQATRPAAKSDAIETNPNYAPLLPQSNTEPSRTEPVISQEMSDIDITDSPLIPTFSTKTAAVFNRFDQFDKAVNKAPLRGSKKRPSTSSGLRDAKQTEFSFPRVQGRTPLNTSARPSFFSTRKSTDATRKSESKGRVEVDFDVERASRRRTRSLDKLLSGNSVTFRALDDPQLPLTEEQKARRWEELLRRSDLAGGTLSVSAGPTMS